MKLLFLPKQITPRVITEAREAHSSPVVVAMPGKAGRLTVAMMPPRKTSTLRRAA